jgi:hypothetical protein
MKSSIFWDTTPCSSLKANWRFGGTCHLYLLGQRISQARNQHEAICLPNFGLHRRQGGNARQQVSSHCLTHWKEWTNKRERSTCQLPLALPFNWANQLFPIQTELLASWLFCLLTASRWLLASLIFWPGRWRRHVPPTGRLTFNGL